MGGESGVFVLHPRYAEHHDGENTTDADNDAVASTRREYLDAIYNSHDDGDGEKVSNGGSEWVMRVEAESCSWSESAPVDISASGISGDRWQGLMICGGVLSSLHHHSCSDRRIKAEIMTVL